MSGVFRGGPEVMRWMLDAFDIVVRFAEFVEMQMYMARAGDDGTTPPPLTSVEYEPPWLFPVSIDWNGN